MECRTILTLTGYLMMASISEGFNIPSTEDIQKELATYGVECADADISDLTTCVFDIAAVKPPLEDQFAACHINCSVVNMLYSCFNEADVGRKCSITGKNFIDNIFGLLESLLGSISEFKIPSCLIDSIKEAGTISNLCPGHELIKIPEWSEWSVEWCNKGAARFNRKCINRYDESERRRGCDYEPDGETKVKAVGKCSDLTGSGSRVYLSSMTFFHLLLLSVSYAWLM